MSKRSRRLERAGEISRRISSTPPVLPRAQERVLQAWLGLGRADLLRGPSPYIGAVYPWARRRRPEVVAPARARRAVLPSVDRRSSLRSLSYHMGLLSFELPARVATCVRRRIRRQVLFALRVGGRRGVGRGRSWRRTEESNYSC